MVGPDVLFGDLTGLRADVVMQGPASRLERLRFFAFKERQDLFAREFGVNWKQLVMKPDDGVDPFGGAGHDGVLQLVLRGGQEIRQKLLQAGFSKPSAEMGELEKCVQVRDRFSDRSELLKPKLSRMQMALDPLGMTRQAIHQNLSGFGRIPSHPLGDIQERLLQGILQQILELALHLPGHSEVEPEQRRQKSAEK
jgi:hypothetical protein